MSSPRLPPVTERPRWPSGEGVDLALLPLTDEELAARIGLPLVQGFDDGLGPWSGIGGRMPSGNAVEFIYYTKKPKPSGVILRLDKSACCPKTFDEALQLVGLSRADLIYVSPLVA